MPVKPEEREQFCMETPEMAAKTIAESENTFNAIIIYCEGVMSDFPSSSTWMLNIIELAKKGLNQ